MSTFRRKAGSKQPSLLAGTRQCQSSLQTVITSTGIPSLDDILGGGLPLSCSLVVLAPDAHTVYGELVQKYFIAQGLACGQDVCVISGDAKEFVRGCMWRAAGGWSEEEELEETSDVKVKIAWRYEQMKRFETTVGTRRAFGREYCETFDLTRRIPESIIEEAVGSGQLICLDVSSGTSGGSRPTTVETLDRLEQALGSEAGPAGRRGRTRALRICVPSLGSAEWGDLQTQDILRFLHSLRRLIRRYPDTCASLSFGSHLCSDDRSWTEKLGWFSDGMITMTGFSANPSLIEGFPSFHGLVRVHRLPGPHTLVPASDRFSTLRGLTSSSENNLAFKCLRKRLIIQTLHLGIDGGLVERRTNVKFE